MEEKTKEEAQRFIETLEQLRRGFGQNILVKLLVTDKGISLTDAATLKDYYSEAQDEEGDDILLNFNEGVNHPAAKICSDLRYLG
jgi:hypothetical protein